MSSSPEVPTHGIPAAKRWVALFDAAERLRQDAASYQPPLTNQVARAIASLFAYEHLLTPATRVLARERLWHRDTPDQPFPASSGDWSRCRCRVCHVARVRQRPVAYERQLAVVRQQRSS